MPRLRSGVRDSFPAPDPPGRACRAALPFRWRCCSDVAAAQVKPDRRRTPQGGVAEWSCSGLQSRVRRFDSDPRLQFCCPGGVIGSRWGLKIPWPQGRAGSTPAPGTNALERAVLSYSGATGGKEGETARTAPIYWGPTTSPRRMLGTVYLWHDLAASVAGPGAFGLRRLSQFVWASRRG